MLLLISLHLVFYFVSGLFECRYSLVEDHEIISTVAKISQEGALATFTDQMHFETRGRFRPLFVVYRVGACVLFGDNIQYHHYFFYGVFILNTLLLFLWGRACGFPLWLSFGFTLLVYTGFHTNVGWRLSNGENFALLFLNFGLLCFSLSLNRNQRRLAIASGALVLMAVLNKESFISCFAFFPLLFINRYHSTEIPWKKFWILSGAVILLMGTYALGIRFLIQDPDAMKYAGSSVSIEDILGLQFGMTAKENYALNFPRIWQTVIFQGSYFQPYVLLLAITSLWGFIYLPFRKTLLLSIAIVFAMLIFHKLLYLRVCLFNIYMYPGVVAMGFLIISIIHQLKIYSKQMAVWSTLLVLLFVLANHGRNSYTYAKEFYLENLAAVSVTDSLISHCANDPIYIQADPLLHVEFVYGIKARLQSFGCTKKSQYFPIEEGDSTEALSIMKFTDPSIIPFVRKQFNKQFSKWITPNEPKTSLDGKNIWVIIQRPDREVLKFEEVEKHLYSQNTYVAPGYYVVSVLTPSVK